MKILLLSVVCLFLFEETYAKSDRVKLKDVQVLTLKKGQYTTARRSRRVPQLACVGGTARCSYIPETVQCYNRGWDGQTINWECKADMEKKYSFGKLEVTCEGYDHPDDSYILAGSCGLEFTINMAPGAYQEKVFKPPPFPKIVSEEDELSGGSIFLIIIVFGVLFFLVYLFLRPARHTSEPSAPPPPPGFRPDLFGSGYDSNYRSSSCGPSPSVNEGNTPGFGTGLFTGGLLGYLFARNTGHQSYTRHHDSYDSFSFSNPGSKTSFSNDHESTETKTKTGFATTKRR